MLLAVIIFTGGVLSARVFTGGGEDTWICEKGEWVRHGNPAVPKPVSDCGGNAVVADTSEVTASPSAKDQKLGGDRDEHGCIGSAGYTWCEAKNKCLRNWEEACIPVAFDESAVIAAIKEQLVKKHGDSAAGMVVTVSRSEGDYVQGGAKDPEGSGGMWFAAKTGGTWNLVWDGNGIITCDDIKGYDFPVSMISECYDTQKGEMNTR